MKQLLPLANPLFTATAQIWLQESGDLVVEKCRPEAGACTLYLITAPEQLLQLLAGCEPGDWVTVVRGKKLPVRGIIDEAFLAHAAAAMEATRPFVVMTPSVYPEPLAEIASGTSARVIQRVLEALLGKTVFVGERVFIPAFDDLTKSDEDRFLFGRKTGGG